MLLKSMEGTQPRWNITPSTFLVPPENSLKLSWTRKLLITTRKTIFWVTNSIVFTSLGPLLITIIMHRISKALYIIESIKRLIINIFWEKLPFRRCGIGVCYTNILSFLSGRSMKVVVNSQSFEAQVKFWRSPKLSSQSCPLPALY